jgi:hypothetical protein
MVSAGGVVVVAVVVDVAVLDMAKETRRDGRVECGRDKIANRRGVAALGMEGKGSE